ncbi:hypothetical protein SAMN04488030_1964 [Aliiroseovarius halocynthiae]|nr:hypothetical protein SAMN04488030_1964 [Aliiroseovarius halocynthiae]
MVLFSIRLGRFGLVVLREATRSRFRIVQEEVGEVMMFFPRSSLIFTNHNVADDAVCLAVH